MRGGPRNASRPCRSILLEDHSCLAAQRRGNVFNYPRRDCADDLLLLASAKLLIVMAIQLAIQLTIQLAIQLVIQLVIDILAEFVLCSSYVAMRSHRADLSSRWQLRRGRSYRG